MRASFRPLLDAQDLKHNGEYWIKAEFNVRTGMFEIYGYTDREQPIVGEVSWEEVVLNDVAEIDPICTGEDEGDPVHEALSVLYGEADRLLKDAIEKARISLEAQDAAFKFQANLGKLINHVRGDE